MDEKVRPAIVSLNAAKAVLAIVTFTAPVLMFGMSFELEWSQSAMPRAR
jgi:hypothetical protein